MSEEMKKNALNTWLVNEINIKGWNQSELARRASLSPTAISDVLSGRRKPGVDFCNGIAAAFSLPAENVYRLAGLLPEEISENDIKEINHLYSSLRYEDSKKRAIEFIEFLLSLEDKHEKNKATKPL